MKLLPVTICCSSLAAAGAARADEKSEAQKAAAAASEAKVRTIKERMKYFDSHVGEWTGEETYELNFGEKEKSVTRDEWKGLFSLDGTHFEMHGEGVDEDGKKTVYKWVCTFDADDEVYRAWYFDSNGNSSLFQMEWDDDEKSLRWTEEDEDEGLVSTFIMKVEQNEITGTGETSRAADGETLWTQTMKYKRKRIRV
jgi:hypothetical protein